MRGREREAPGHTASREVGIDTLSATKGNLSSLVGAGSRREADEAARGGGEAMPALRFPASEYVIGCVDGGRIDLPSEHRISQTPSRVLTQRCGGSFRIRHPGREHGLRMQCYAAFDVCLSSAALISPGASSEFGCRAISVSLLLDLVRLRLGGTAPPQSPGPGTAFHMPPQATKPCSPEGVSRTVRWSTGRRSAWCRARTRG